jgi:hypothetical protein
MSEGREDKIISLLGEISSKLTVLIRLFEKYDQDLFENDEELREIELKQSGLNRSKNIRRGSGGL